LVIVGAIVGFVAAILLLEFGLSAKAPHAAVLGPWLLQGDGSAPNGRDWIEISAF
jgi:hypothetical protein